MNDKKNEQDKNAKKQDNMNKDKKKHEQGETKKPDVMPGKGNQPAHPAKK